MVTGKISDGHNSIEISIRRTEGTFPFQGVIKSTKKQTTMTKLKNFDPEAVDVFACEESKKTETVRMVRLPSVS